jgi:hypothetical protein
MIYATDVFSSKPHWQSSSITRRIGAALVAVVVLTCTDLRSAEPWREAPEYLTLFAPPAYRTAYRAYVSPVGLDATLKTLLADPAVLHPPGAWEPHTMIPFDAFGLSGGYNRWKVAGLYRSRRVQVARGPRMDQGQAESWMLVAPYPDVTLQRLEPGTLIIVLRIPAADIP